MLMDTRRFHKGSMFNRLEMVLGKGLITLDGQAWLDARRRVQLAFRNGQLAQQQEIVIRHTLEMIDRLKEVPRGRPVDLAPVSSELMLRIALELLFGASPDMVELEPALEAVDVCNEYVKQRVWSVTPESWNTPRRRRFLQALHCLESIVDRVIQERQKESPAQRAGRCDVLSLLFEAGFQGVELRDHVMTMLIAGHETTATAISFLFAIVAKRPQVQEHLYQEAKDFPPGEAPLDALPFAQAVWNETIRLYPPVPILDRKAVEETELGEYRIPAGANILWSPYGMQRKFCANPDAFDPQRFLDGPKLPRHAFIPFGEGPRQCIGKPLADMEGVTIAALFAQAFRLESADSQEIAVSPKITLQPKRGVAVRLHPRERLPIACSRGAGIAADVEELNEEVTYAPTAE
jgi:cytochrome P450